MSTTSTDRFEKIRLRFEAEARERKRPRVATDLPHVYEDINPEWLTAILASRHPGAQVTSCRLGPADNGTSSRRRIELEWNEAGRRAGLPASVFCKGSLSLANRYILALSGGIEAEVVFYQRVRPKLALEAPRPLHAHWDPESFNSIIVMEDMTGEVEFLRCQNTLSRERAEGQMRLLATLHGAYYDRSDLPQLAPFRTWEYFFDVIAEEAGFREACARGFHDARDVIPERLFRRESEIWPATRSCVARHAALPRGLVHSDVHLGNWYVTRAGTMGVSDWQCTCKGNWSRDLAYVISTSLEPNDRRAWEKDLLGLYLDALHAAGGAKVDFDEAFTLYRQQLFSALAWWTGTLGQPPEAPAMQPPSTSRTFIARMALAIDDLDALDA
jgi:aminoglycoside phosphotransferase (APT) family kinase protein